MCDAFASLTLKFMHLLLNSLLCVLAGWFSVFFRRSYCTVFNCPKVNYLTEPNETMLYNTPRWCLELPKSQQRQGQENSQRYKLFRPAVACRPLVWYWPYICHARSLVNTVNLLLWICKILGWGNIFWGNYTSQHLLCPKAVPGPHFVLIFKGRFNPKFRSMEPRTRDKMNTGWLIFLWVHVFTWKSLITSRKDFNNSWLVCFFYMLALIFAFSSCAPTIRK